MRIEAEYHEGTLSVDERGQLKSNGRPVLGLTSRVPLITIRYFWQKAQITLPIKWVVIQDRAQYTPPPKR